ncbi:PPOX class F420-dependent oxidoreductase [Actinoplanes regularis]|uniref:PPOX class F420-dependent oxidoreductase n=1 Tax=Actinoplanes regularis TaxID=52697 RepID=UPI00249FDDD4|nr:PPOX class F420-dependent oxidoreductase [Actinoplanes regularis]GLW31760.1 PPOX class F420-dependent oxidoreductase [Actinoplanes regularis]
MTFSAVELEYLAGQVLGRLATVQPDGSPQVNPVGFRWNAATGTIDIGGYNMAASRKFRNVADNGRVAFVVDDVPSTNPWRVRCLEIRGRGEAITEPDAIIRIHPQRILAFGIDEPDREPHRLAVNKRNVAEAQN